MEGIAGSVKETSMHALHDVSLYTIQMILSPYGFEQDRIEEIRDGHLSAVESNRAFTHLFESAGVEF